MTVADSGVFNHNRNDHHRNALAMCWAMEGPVWQS